MIENTNLWAVMRVLHASGVVGTGPSMRLQPAMCQKLRDGQLTPTDLFGTEESPGVMRRRLQNVLPTVCLNPEAEVRFVLQDAQGVEVKFDEQPTRKSIDEMAVAAFSALDEESVAPPPVQKPALMHAARQFLVRVPRKL